MVAAEMELQLSGMVDESTAVKIGKLSGAEVIAIGSVYEFGGLHYLNVQLLAVETAEIVGSSIAVAEGTAGFLEMANQAVYKLF